MIICEIQSDTAVNEPGLKAGLERIGHGRLEVPVRDSGIVDISYSVARISEL